MTKARFFSRGGRHIIHGLFLDKCKGFHDMFHHTMKTRARFGMKNRSPEVANHATEGNGTDRCFWVENNAIKTDTSKCF